MNEWIHFETSVVSLFNRISVIRTSCQVWKFLCLAVLLFFVLMSRLRKKLDKPRATYFLFSHQSRGSIIRGELNHN